MIKTVKDNSLINEHNRNNNVAWLTNISSCIWLSKVTDILEKTIDNTEIRKRCVNILNEKVKQISSFKIVDVKKFKKIFNCYTYHYLNCKIGSARQFMVDCSNNNISRYFKVKYIGSKRQKSQRGNKSPKNIIMDFNSDYFAKQTGRYEDIPLYPTCYCHYFMLAFLLDIMTTGEMVLPKYRKNNSFYKKFLTILFENLNSSVLTGLEAYSEYELSYPYCCVYDELRKLTSAYQDKLVFSATLHNKSFEATIKDYSLITEMFAKFRGAWIDKDVGQIIPNPSSKSGEYKITSNDVIQIHKDEHDQISGVFSKIRITEGSEGNKIIVHIALSGQRIINRIFDRRSNVNNNVKTHNIIDYIPNTANMIAFILWSVLSSTVEAENNYKNFKPSILYVLGNYVEKYIKTKGGKPARNIVINTAIPIILSEKTKAEQEEFINTYFTEKQSQQKAFIRAGINEINRIKTKKRTELFTERLRKDLKYVYNW